MTAGEFQAWMSKAFLVVESALAMELATPSRVCMTDEYLRSSLVQGLSYSMPANAARVTAELPVSWTGSPCWRDPTHPISTGRPIQHDVAVQPDAVDSGLVCEVKWLKQAKADELAKDIWKLALSRSNTAEGQALRTYLLVGGEGDALSDTLATLRKNRIDLRWSQAGRQGRTPGPREVSLRRFLDKKLGEKALGSLLSWGNKPNKHYRTPSHCWSALRVSVRATWLRSADTARWRAILWELDHRGTENTDEIDWNTVSQSWSFGC
jgi:hypothetical protein